MKSLARIAITVAGGVAAAVAPATLSASLTSGAMHGAPTWAAGPAAGLVRPHQDMGAAKPPSSGGTSPNMTFHGGPVMTNGADVTAVYWGSRWLDTTFAGDKKSGLAELYVGLGGSPYHKSNTEYTQSNGLAVSSAVTWRAPLANTTVTPGGAPSTSAVLGVVANALSAASVTPPGNGSGYYPVYSDQPRGSAGYCAWHSTGTINNVRVQFAFFFNLDSDSGCNPNSSLTGSQGLKALANVTGHELSEAVSDPQLNAWYDSRGYENADKCAWTFGTSVYIGLRDWKIQGNWSNKAYNANQGYTRGCIQTGPA